MACCLTAPSHYWTKGDPDSWWHGIIRPQWIREITWNGHRISGCNIRIAPYKMDNITYPLNKLTRHEKYQAIRLGSIVQRVIKLLFCIMSLKIKHSKLLPHPQRANEFMWWLATYLLLHRTLHDSRNIFSQILTKTAMFASAVSACVKR